jgi:hypothetical protein
MAGGITVDTVAGAGETTVGTVTTDMVTTDMATTDMATTDITKAPSVADYGSRF